jgi:RHS repeat-associated protein
MHQKNPPFHPQKTPENRAFSGMVSIRSATDYSPFGVQLENRNFLRNGLAEDFRMGFQGQEEDDDVKGDGNSVNYKYRMHDSRLGRFFSVDPLAKDYPLNSPYAFSENNVIHCIELEGLEKFQITDDGFGNKTLTLIDVSADFEVIDEYNNSISHFKYCEFQRLMKGWQKLYDSGIHEGTEVGKVNGIYVPKSPGQKEFRESNDEKSSTFSSTFKNPQLMKPRDNEFGISSNTPPTIDEIQNELWEWIGNSPSDDPITGEKGFDIIRVYLPDITLQAEFIKQWKINGYETAFDYNAEDIVFLKNAEGANGSDLGRSTKNSSDAFQIHFNKYECEE